MNTEKALTCEQTRKMLCQQLSTEDDRKLREHLETCAFCFESAEKLASDIPQTAWQEQLSNDDLDQELTISDEPNVNDFAVEFLDPGKEASAIGSIGGYDIHGILGRGGMGVVMKGFDPALKRYVAIKALAPSLASHPIARKRFAREAQAAAAVVHLNVMSIHHVQPHGKLPFIVMPLVAGESLAERLRRVGSLELTEILRIGIQTAAGLAAAHSQGLVHRDIKPSNILLDLGTERVVLTDFGLARAVDDVSLTRTNAIAGTPEYMSPEAARGEAVDGRSDLFSLGCVLYAMATGASPFRANSTMAVLTKVAECHPRPLSAVQQHLPPWFTALVDRLLEKDPNHRFESAKEVECLLEQGLAHLQHPRQTPPPTVHSRIKRDQIRRSERIYWRFLIPALLLLTVGGWYLQATLLSDPPGDISGQWKSRDLSVITLIQTSPGKYVGQYQRFDSAANLESSDKQGTIHLQWAPIKKIYQGTWSQGNSKFGDLTVRWDGNELRGALSVSEKSPAYSLELNHLTDLHWVRVTGEASGPVNNLGSKESVKPSSDETVKKSDATPIHPVTVIAYADGKETTELLRLMLALFDLPPFTLKSPAQQNLAFESKIELSFKKPPAETAVSAMRLAALMNFGQQKVYADEEHRQRLLSGLLSITDSNHRSASWERVQRTGAQAANETNVSEHASPEVTDRKHLKNSLRLLADAERSLSRVRSLPDTDVVHRKWIEYYNSCLDLVTVSLIDDEQKKREVAIRIEALSRDLMDEEQTTRVKVLLNAELTNENSKPSPQSPSDSTFYVGPRSADEVLRGMKALLTICNLPTDALESSAGKIRIDATKLGPDTEAQRELTQAICRLLDGSFARGSIERSQHQIELLQKLSARTPRGFARLLDWRRTPSDSEQRRDLLVKDLGALPPDIAYRRLLDLSSVFGLTNGDLLVEINQKRANIPVDTNLPGMNYGLISLIAKSSELSIDEKQQEILEGLRSNVIQNLTEYIENEGAKSLTTFLNEGQTGSEVLDELFKKQWELKFDIEKRITQVGSRHPEIMTLLRQLNLIQLQTKARMEVIAKARFTEKKSQLLKQIKGDIAIQSDGQPTPTQPRFQQMSIRYYDAETVVKRIGEFEQLFGVDTHAPPFIEARTNTMLIEGHRIGELRRLFVQLYDTTGSKDSQVDQWVQRAVLLILLREIRGNVIHP